MNFNSTQFVIFSLIAIALLRVTPIGRWRNIILLSLNAFFVSSFADDLSQLVPLVVFIVACYGIILLVSRASDATGIGLLLVIASFVWLKRYSVVDFLPALPPPYLLVGLSFILFRILHLIVDVAQGAARTPRFVDYLNYLFFFPTFVSGPIQRFQDFSTQMAMPKINDEIQHATLALNRIILGYFMVIVVGSLTSHLIQDPFYSTFTSNLSLKAIFLFAVAAAIQMVHLYFNFAGYMHICIGIGNLAGFTLPENFDKPFSAKNFLDFWSRWHITLSNWFKFYLFNPLLKLLSARWGSPKNMPYLGAVAFFATFLTMGLWHGSTSIYFIYGLLFGFGASLNRLWQILTQKWLGKNEYKQLCTKPWYILTSSSLALSFFAIALTCMWITPDQIKVFENGRAIAFSTAAFFVLSVIIAAIIWITGLVFSTIKNRQKIVAATSESMANPTLIALKLFALANLHFILSGVQEPIYRAF